LRWPKRRGVEVIATLDRRHFRAVRLGTFRRSLTRVLLLV
jgi:hypothetical protein